MFRRRVKPLLITAVVIFGVFSSMSCGAATGEEILDIESLEQKSDADYEIGKAIYFERVGDDDEFGTLAQAHSSAVVRWRHATCLNIKSLLVPGAAISHKISWGKMTQPDRIGQATGNWRHLNIRLNPRLQQPNFPNASQAARTLAHEFYHALARRNDHCPYELSATGKTWSDVNALIDECALGRVCAVQDCQCFIPESDLE